MSVVSSRVYRFGAFRLNVEERLLERDGRIVPLTPKVFDTLLLLVENGGHVLGKTELMESLWPDSFVEESSLAQNISLLRRALGDTGGERQYIETIPKHGYRFVARLEPELASDTGRFSQAKTDYQESANLGTVIEDESERMVEEG